MVRITTAFAGAAIAITVLFASPAAGSALDMSGVQRRDAHAALAKRQAGGMPDGGRLRKRCPAKPKASTQLPSAANTGADKKPQSATPPPSTTSSHHPTSTSSPHTSSAPTHKPTSTSTTTHKTSSSKPPPPPKTTSKTSSKPAPPKATTESAPPSSGGRKRILAYSGGNVDLNAWHTSKVYGTFNWGQNAPSGVAAHGLKFIPNLHDPSQTGGWVSGQKAARPPYAIHFNEPDLNGISVGEAISSWRNDMMPLQSVGTRLCTPGVSNAGSGLPFIQGMFDGCSECRASTSCLTLHAYDSNVTRIINYLNKAHEQFPDLPIVLGEVGCTGFGGGIDSTSSCSDPSGFMSELMSFIDSKDWMLFVMWTSLQGAPGGIDPNNIICGGNGEPNSLGRKYID